MIACLFDMGLICVPSAIAIVLFPALGIWLRKKFKWCKKPCACDCHEKKHESH
jgi:hypothetical protein